MDIKECDIVVIGAGPAGLSAAVKLLNLGIKRVAVFEQGNQIDERYCNVLSGGKCKQCARCQLLTGVGGASGILGGKLCFFPAGMALANHTSFSTENANEVLLSFLKNNRITQMLNLPREINKGVPIKSIGCMQYKEYYARPLLRPILQRLFYRLYSELSMFGGVLRTGAQVFDIKSGKGDHRFDVYYNHDGEKKKIQVKTAIVLASGRSNTRWLSKLFNDLGVVKHPSKVDIGVRLEFPSGYTRNLPQNLQDPKLKIFPGTPQEVRTLCWCRDGQLSQVKADGINLVDGHFGEKWQPFTSVSIVARIPVPLESLPLRYAISKFRTIGYQRLMHQNLRKFLGIHSLNGRISNIINIESEEANLRSIIPKTILERLTYIIEELDTFLGARLLSSHDSLVYAPVIDNFWETPVLDNRLMTQIPGLYVAGDTTGLARGIVQAIFGGIVVAHSIAGRKLERIAESSECEIALSGVV